MASTAPSAAGLPMSIRRARWEFWRGELLSVVVLLAIGIFFFWSVLSGKHHFISTGDTSDLILPYETMLRNFFKAGVFPLWAPNNFGGFPTIGYPQFGMFYPVNIFMLWVGGIFDISPATIYSYNFVLHVIL